MKWGGLKQDIEGISEGLRTEKGYMGEMGCGEIRSREHWTGC